MRSLSLSLVIDGVQTPAVLCAPAQPVAALLLVPGSLNSDVDGNYAPMFPGQPAVRPHAYADLAEQLAARQIVVLRFAKTGPGSGSTVVDATVATAAYREFPQRVRVAAAFLAELRARAPGLPVVVAGHSEGAIVAAQLAQRDPAIGALVNLSGPAQPLLRMMIEAQLGADPRALAQLADFVAGRAIVDPIGPLAFATQPAHAPYLRSLEAIDPVAEFAAVRQPALIVHGERDASVPVAHAAVLHAAKPAAALARFAELQHFYKRVPPGLSAHDSFADSSTSDPAVAEAIARWVATT